MIQNTDCPAPLNDEKPPGAIPGVLDIEGLVEALRDDLLSVVRRVGEFGGGG